MTSCIDLPPITILYLGGSNGHGIKNVIAGINRPYIMHVFEPLASSFNTLVSLFKKEKSIHLHHGACVGEHGHDKVRFFKCEKDGSSSLGEFDERWHHDLKDFKMNTVLVPSIYLPDFCVENAITYIDIYISDIQGADFTVLNSMKPFIDGRKIKRIQCEVTKNGKRNIYKTLPSNEESQFDKLLSANYDKIAKGWDTLEDHVYTEVPDEWWEFDMAWTLKPDTIKLIENYDYKKPARNNIEDILNSRRESGPVTEVQSLAKRDFCANIALASAEDEYKEEIALDITKLDKLNINEEDSISNDSSSSNKDKTGLSTTIEFILDFDVENIKANRTLTVKVINNTTTDAVNSVTCEVYFPPGFTDEFATKYLNETFMYQFSYLLDLVNNGKKLTLDFSKADKGPIIISIINNIGHVVFELPADAMKKILDQ